MNNRLIVSNRWFSLVIVGSSLECRLTKQDENRENSSGELVDFEAIIIF